MPPNFSSKRLIPAAVEFIEGVPYSSRFDDVYHSADGGLAQARHVFIGGNRLPQRWRQRERFTILETGFGLGLNFLATWQACRDDAERPRQLHYVAIEKHPFSAADLGRLHAMWPELAGLSAALRAAWPPLAPGLHRLFLDEGRVVLTLVFGDVADCLPQLDLRADAFYLDGFAPAKNPDMWAPTILARLNRLAAPGATLATYTIASAVRQALAQAGFTWERVPGFGRKPEMLYGQFAPRWQQAPLHGAAAAATAAAPARSAIVLGAGIAGSAMCERLAARGWQVTLVDRHAQAAQEASGNLAGIAMPLLSRDDNRVSRLARAAYLFSVRHWRHLGGIGKAFTGADCGVLQLAQDAQHAQAQRAAVDAASEDFARWLAPAAITARYGIPNAHGGWLFPQGGWVRPSSLCAAMLDACGQHLQRRFSQDAARLARAGGQWQVLAQDGTPIAQAPVLILAGGTHGNAFTQTQALPLNAMRGQVTHVPAAALPPVPLVVCGDGYVTPASDGLCSVGATYDTDDDTALRADSQRQNLQRLAQLLPHAAALDDLQQHALAGRVGFRCMSPDRLPLVGALPDPDAAIAGSRLRDVPRLPGLYGLLAYGSRGLIWAPLMAELLASRLEGAPLPVERELAEALDPARFALKAYRRGN
jgi:tRNA 5-methylaminomethyl-2-thiouridine biosynthesis bifunctional protein